VKLFPPENLGGEPTADRLANASDVLSFPGTIKQLCGDPAIDPDAS